jgi:hypothetical protein
MGEVGGEGLMQVFEDAAALLHEALVHRVFSDADPPESRGCPNLLLPDDWSRHVKSALCQAADTRQGRTRRAA